MVEFLLDSLMKKRSNCTCSAGKKWERKDWWDYYFFVASLEISKSPSLNFIGLTGALALLFTDTVRLELKCFIIIFNVFFMLGEMATLVSPVWDSRPPSLCRMLFRNQRNVTSCNKTKREDLSKQACASCVVWINHPNLCHPLRKKDYHAYRTFLPRRLTFFRFCRLLSVCCLVSTSNTSFSPFSLCYHSFILQKTLVYFFSFLIFR